MAEVSVETEGLRQVLEGKQTELAPVKKQVSELNASLSTTATVLDTCLRSCQWLTSAGLARKSISSRRSARKPKKRSDRSARIPRDWELRSRYESSAGPEDACVNCNTLDQHQEVEGLEARAEGSRGMCMQEGLSDTLNYG